MWKSFAIFLLFGVVAGQESHWREIPNLFENQCKLYGAENHVGQITEGVLNFMTCSNNLIDLDKLIKSNEYELLPLLKTTCKSQSEIVNCFYKPLETMSPCLYSELKLDVLKQSIRELTDLFCKDDSKSLSEFLNDGAISCMIDKSNTIAACAEHIQILEKYEPDVNVFCSKLRKLTDCVIGVLEGCPKPSTADFTRILFKTALKGTPCTANGSGANRSNLFCFYIFSFLLPFLLYCLSTF